MITKNIIAISERMLHSIGPAPSSALPPVPAPVSCQLPSPGSAVVLAGKTCVEQMEIPRRSFGENISYPLANLT